MINLSLILHTSPTIALINVSFSQELELIMNYILEYLVFLFDKLFSFGFDLSFKNTVENIEPLRGKFRVKLCFEGLCGLFEAFKYEWIVLGGFKSRVRFGQ